MRLKIKSPQAAPSTSIHPSHIEHTAAAWICWAAAHCAFRTAKPAVPCAPRQPLLRRFARRLAVAVRGRACCRHRHAATYHLRRSTIKNNGIAAGGGPRGGQIRMPRWEGSCNAGATQALTQRCWKGELGFPEPVERRLHVAVHSRRQHAVDVLRHASASNISLLRDPVNHSHQAKVRQLLRLRRRHERRHDWGTLLHTRLFNFRLRVFVVRFQCDEMTDRHFR